MAKTVLFLHGFQDERFDPEEKGKAIKERLSKDGWEVYNISYSSGLPTERPLDHYVVVLTKMIDELGLKKIDAVIGHSMGGLIACSLAKRYRRYGIKAVIMLETPMFGVPGWLLRVWRLLFQRHASFSWASIQDMKQGSSFFTFFNEDWPEEIHRFEVGGKLSLTPVLRNAYKIPQGTYIVFYPEVKHDGPAGLRGDPEVLEFMSKILRLNC